MPQKCLMAESFQAARGPCWARYLAQRPSLTSMQDDQTEGLTLCFTVLGDRIDPDICFQ